MTRNSARNGSEELVLHSPGGIDITPHESLGCDGGASASHSSDGSLSPAAVRAVPSSGREADSSSISWRASARSPLLTPLIRCLLALWGLFLLAGFSLAWHLEPSPRGHGTHQQLGFPPCSIQFLFGVPCPGCGMTTSFAWYVRGNWIKAWQANPAGLYLAILCTGLIPWAWIAVWRGSGWGFREWERNALLALLPLVLLGGGHWCIRLFYSL